MVSNAATEAHERLLTFVRNRGRTPMQITFRPAHSVYPTACVLLAAMRCPAWQARPQMEGAVALKIIRRDFVEPAIRGVSYAAAQTMQEGFAPSPTQEQVLRALEVINSQKEEVVTRTRADRVVIFLLLTGLVRTAENAAQSSQVIDHAEKLFHGLLARIDPAAADAALVVSGQDAVEVTRFMKGWT